MTKILGISAYYHDSASALIVDGEIIAAAQEERFTRIKHDASFPAHAVEFCLQKAGISSEDLDAIAFYEKPLLKFKRLLATFFHYAPRGMDTFVHAMDAWSRKRLWTKSMIRKRFNFKGPIYTPEHHQSHAAAAFFPSPFQEAAFLAIDGVGEWQTATYGTARDNHLDIMADILFPHSLGMLYSAFTYYLGFKVNSGEYKVMGLAPYGEPKYKDKIFDHLIDVKEDGSFRLNMKYFNYCVGHTMTNQEFDRLFGAPPRKPESKLEQRDMDLAASIQCAIEDILLKMAQHIHKVTRAKHLCLAGGVALNCVANGKLLKKGLFEDMWVQPAAGDAGSAVGAALFVYHQIMGKRRVVRDRLDSMRWAYLGPDFSDEQIARILDGYSAKYEKIPLSHMPQKIADLLAQGNIIGWFQGRMEFGPRALGARSIIGDPRVPEMQRRMNLKIKFRESFRPFAPSVLFEKASSYFDLGQESPYMLFVTDVRKERQKPMSPDQSRLFGLDKLNIERSDIPAVTHVDYSARVHTVTKDSNPLFYKTIECLDKSHGCPVVINTSFNVRGEPIVCSPRDAYACFMRTNIDYLVMGPYLIDKKEQLPIRPKATQYELD